MGFYKTDLLNLNNRSYLVNKPRHTIILYKNSLITDYEYFADLVSGET